MMDQHEACKILQLTPPINSQSLKKQYKAMVLKYHPDKNGGSPEATQKFMKIKEAYDLLLSIRPGETGTPAHTINKDAYYRNHSDVNPDMTQHGAGHIKWGERSQNFDDLIEEMNKKMSEKLREMASNKEGIRKDKPKDTLKWSFKVPWS